MSALLGPLHRSAQALFVRPVAKARRCARPPPLYRCARSVWWPVVDRFLANRRALRALDACERVQPQKVITPFTAKKRGPIVARRLAALTLTTLPLAPRAAPQLTERTHAGPKIVVPIAPLLCDPPKR